MVSAHGIRSIVRNLRFATESRPPPRWPGHIGGYRGQRPLLAPRVVIYSTGNKNRDQETIDDHGTRARDLEKGKRWRQRWRGCVPVLTAVARVLSNTARSSSRAWRRMLKEREGEFESAIHQDLGRPSLEIYASEIALIASELALTRKKLRAWTRPQRVPTSLVAQPGKSRIYHDPLGVVLIIGPWNYPLQLVLAPLVGAIAAGNCAIVKPSEVVPTISAVLAERLPEYVDPECVQVIEGGVDETTELLSQRSIIFSIPAMAPSGGSSWKRPPST